MKRLAALLIVLAVATAAASAAEPVEISVVLALTGSQAFAGDDARDTLVAFQNVVNREGGIRGRPLNFVFADSQGNPATAVSLTNDILATKHPALIVGDTTVATCNAMAPLVKNGPVQFCLSPGFRPERGGYSYVVGLSALQQMSVIFRILRERGWTRVALVVGTDATGRLAEPEFAQTAALPENRDVQIVTVEHFNITDISIAAQVEHIRASSAQMIIAWVNGAPFGTVVRSLKDGGVALPLFAGVGNLNYKELQTFEPLLPPQLYFCCVGPLPAAGQPPQRGPLQAAQTKYMDTFKALGIKPSFSHAGAWDAGLVIVDALRAVGPDARPQQIRAYVNNLHGLSGVEAVFDFRSGDMRGLPTSWARLLKWDPSKEAWFVASGPGAMVQ